VKIFERFEEMLAGLIERRCAFFLKNNMSLIAKGNQQLIVQCVIYFKVHNAVCILMIINTIQVNKFRGEINARMCGSPAFGSAATGWCERCAAVSGTGARWPWGAGGSGRAGTGRVGRGDRRPHREAERGQCGGESREGGKELKHALSESTTSVP